MSLMIAVKNVRMLEKGVWLAEVPPHQILRFGEPKMSCGEISVLMMDDYEFDEPTKTLTFDMEAVAPLNVGTSPRVIALCSRTGTCSRSAQSGPEKIELGPTLGPGDHEFIRLARTDLSEEMAKTAEKLLFAVRKRSSGDLKRGKTRNFSETPDNFWYVIIQPRIDALSITVRGDVSRFEPTARLGVKDDRGNTRFKVESEADLPAALDLIFQAVRKK